MKRPSCNKLMLWGLLFAALVGLTVCFLNRQYSLASVISSIKTADPLWLIPGVLAMGLFFVCSFSSAVLDNQKFYTDLISGNTTAFVHYNSSNSVDVLFCHFP